MLNSAIIFLFHSFIIPTKTWLRTRTGRDWILWRASWWLDEATPQTHHQLHPFRKFRSSSFPLHAAHPCATVPISCTDHTLWQRLLRLYGCQPGVAVLACAHGVERDQGTAVRMVSAAMQGGSGFAGRTGPCCFCILVCSVPVSWSASVLSVSIYSSLCHSPSTSDFRLLSLSLLLNNVLGSMVTGLVLALSSLTHGVAKLHRLQDISLLKLSKSNQEIMFSDLW